MASAAALQRLAAFAEAARLSPHDADRQMFHGNALADAGQPEAAIVAYRATLALRPAHGPAHYNLGNALLATGDPAAAEASYVAALGLVPDHAGCLNNRGNALRQLNRVADAAASYQAALALQPDSAGTHNNLASALLALHQPEAALASLQTALRLAPDYPDACNNMGGTLLALDQPEAALPWFRRAVTLDPEQVQARFGEAMALLGLGRLREGFAAYEARWLDPSFRADGRDYAAPLWLGETDLAGRTVLLHAEQGLGDTIQFVRYAALLRACGARVVLEVQAPLLSLLAPLADSAVSAGDILPDHDLHTPLLSLPLALATELHSIPASIPYLPQPVPHTRLRGPGLNVALTIAGSRDHPEDALRSIEAPLLEPLLTCAGITWHLLQHDASEADAAWAAARGLRRVTGLTDFQVTAAVLGAMDLVVSVDTAVAHLAGALGRPVWVLLQHAADFRWLRARDDTPWYPTMRLFRQGPQRRWEPVLADVTAALTQAAAGRATGPRPAGRGSPRRDAPPCAR